MAGKKPNKLAIAVGTVVHTTALTLTWRDLGRRSAQEVRGPKNVWRVVSALNTIGSVAYWLFGRRPKVHSEL